MPEQKPLSVLSDLVSVVMRDQHAHIMSLEDDLEYERELSDEYLEQLKLSMAANARKRKALRLLTDKLQARRGFLGFFRRG